MSFDISLQGWVHATVFDVGNYTSNVSGMWTKALGFPLRSLKGKRASEVLPELNRAVSHMVNNREEYIPMNPPNGWGDYEGALEYLRKLRDGCAANPDAEIHISC